MESTNKPESRPPNSQEQTEESILQNLEIEPDFQIQSLEDLTWLTKKIFNLDSQTETLSREKAAIEENYSTMLSQVQEKREFLLKRFGAESKRVIEAYAPHGSKSVTTPYGKVGVTEYRGKIVVKGQIGEAFMESEFPSSVEETTVRKAKVSLLTDEQRTALFQMVADGKAAGIEVVPPEDARLYISPGLKEKGS